MRLVAFRPLVLALTLAVSASALAAISTPVSAQSQQGVHRIQFQKVQYHHHRRHYRHYRRYH